MSTATPPQKQPPTPDPLKDEDILHEVEPKPPTDPKKKKIILSLVVVFVLIAGTLTGYFLSRGSEETPTTESGMPGFVITGAEEGSADKETFRDSTEGILKKGGLDGEGTHHLVRGDESQTAYLTSSVIDLNKYVDMKVQVWGETFAAQKAGWFMDVGRIKVLDAKP